MVSGKGWRKMGQKGKHLANLHGEEMEFLKHSYFWFPFLLLLFSSRVTVKILTSWHASSEARKHFCTTALLWHLIDHAFPSLACSLPQQKHYSFEMNQSSLHFGFFRLSVCTLRASLFHLPHGHWKSRSDFIPASACWILFCSIYLSIN